MAEESERGSGDGSGSGKAQGAVGRITNLTTDSEKGLPDNLLSEAMDLLAGSEPNERRRKIE